jgi:GNAT superfamily N-acetyltransferase
MKSNPFNYSFSPLQSKRELDLFMTFEQERPLGYKGFKDWLGRAEAEVISGYKQVILAFYYRDLIGVIVDQPDKKNPFLREVKNMRVADNHQGRFIGSFLLRQVEVEARKQRRYLGMTVDVREDRPELVQLLMLNGFVPRRTISLYESDKKDVIMLKDLSKPRTPLVV